MPRKNSVAFNRRPDPPFIRQFKERVAYKEGNTVETKKQKLVEDDREIEREDEAPQVVQLKSSDLSEQEYKTLKSKKDIEDSAASSGKILFKKPTKRQAEEASNQTENTEKQESSISASSLNDKKKQKKLEEIKDKLKSSDSIDIKAVKNKKLLSFGEDEEDE